MMKAVVPSSGRLKSTGFIMLDSIVKRGRSRGAGAVRGVEALVRMGKRSTCTFNVKLLKSLIHPELCEPGQLAPKPSLSLREVPFQVHNSSYERTPRDTIRKVRSLQIPQSSSREQQGHPNPLETHDKRRS